MLNFDIQCAVRNHYFILLNETLCVNISNERTRMTCWAGVDIQGREAADTLSHIYLLDSDSRHSGELTNVHCSPSPTLYVVVAQ